MTNTNFESNPTSWLCNDDSTASCLASQAKKAKPWVVKGFEVRNCLSLQKEERCELQFSLGILSVVILCNLIKAICVLVTVWKMNHPTFVVIGDCISSFLQCPDETTTSMCLASKMTVQAGIWHPFPPPLRWDNHSYRWFSAASRVRWAASNILYGYKSLPLAL